jgi:uncharacterized protein (PEP-CTERM system associated)
MSRTHAKHAVRPLCGLLALAAAGAAAQTADAPNLGYGVLPMTGAGARAADAPTSGNGRGFYITPSVGVAATLTDNVNLTSTNKQADLIASITPAVQIGGQSGRVKGFLDYALTINAYARGTSGNLQNSLNAQVSAEAVKSWLYVDANASITQQYISPFGTQSANSALVNSNSTTVSTLGISPYLRGQIAGQVNYEARVNYTYTNSGTSQASNSSTLAGLIHFDSTTRWSMLGWGADLIYTAYDFSQGRSTNDQLATGRLTYAFTPEFNVSARANIESTNTITLQNQTYTGWGWGLDWNPSPRTHLFLTEDQRYFGTSHVYGFDYRTPRTVWRISSTQGVSTGQYNSGRGNPYSAFDLLFAQFATVEPDPVLRAQLVNNFLQSNGINPNAPVTSNYLPNQVQEQRVQEISVALMGIQSTLIFNANQTYSRNLGVLSNPGNDFANGNLTHWRGFGISWAHPLTPQSTLSVNATQQKTYGTQSSQSTDLLAAYAMWSTQLSRRASASISARRQVFRSNTAPYNETAMIGNLTMTF